MNNAPPDTGVGKSDDAGARISNLAADLVVSGWMASNAQDVERHKKEAEQKLLDFACDEVERHIKRDPSVMPDHGGADAGVKPREYWQMMYTDLLKRVDTGEFKPAPVAANASADARLREDSMRGLTDLERTLLIAAKAGLNYIANTESELGMTLKSGDLLRAAIAKAEACKISQHPHASDCDKKKATVGLDWKLSEETIKHLEEIERATVRPGDPRLNQIICGGHASDCSEQDK